MEFYKRDKLFLLLCYEIIRSGAKKVLLSVIWNLMLIEIHLSQIRKSDSKRENVCAVCPYLSLFTSKICIAFFKFLTTYLNRAANGGFKYDIGFILI